MSLTKLKLDAVVVRRTHLLESTKWVDQHEKCLVPPVGVWGIGSAEHTTHAHDMS